jgi:hypothetical protein
VNDRSVLPHFSNVSTDFSFQGKVQTTTAALSQQVKACRRIDEWSQYPDRFATTGCLVEPSVTHKPETKTSTIVEIATTGVIGDFNRRRNLFATPAEST